MRGEDIVLFGGAKFPGKTHALLFEATRQIDKPAYKALLLRRTFPQLQELMDRAEIAFPKMGAKWEGEEKRWRFPSGAFIRFGHCEHEKSKLIYQGQEFAFIGFDQMEEFLESQVRFIIAQNRTTDPTIHCYVRGTANPGGVGHWWIKRKFITGKKPLQTYTEDFGEYQGKRLTRTFCYVPATIYDNPTGLQANPGYLANLKSLPEQERKALLEGDWDAYDTGCAFDANGLKAQDVMIREPVMRGLLRDMPSGRPEILLDDNGPLTIWKLPQQGSQYFIPADVAKGVEGGDNSVAPVIDRSTWEVVAKLCGKFEPTEFGRALYGLGLFYNTAKIAVEVWPGPGGTTQAELLRSDYPKDRLYRRLNLKGEKYAETNDFGWVTDERGRHDVVTALQDAILHKRIILRDQEALDELRSFVRNERGRWEARSGSHDDHVIALGIACFCMVHDPVSELLGREAITSKIIGSVVKLPESRVTGNFRNWRNRRQR